MAKVENFWKDPEFYLTLILLGFIVSVLVSCLYLSSKARLIPLTIAVGALPLTLLNLLACVSTPLRARVSALKSVEIVSVKQAEPQEETKKPAPFTEMLKIALWFGGAYVVFFFAGYLPMVVAFSIFFLKFRICFTWLRSATLAAVFGLATWIIFSTVLGVEPFGIEYYY